MSRENKSISEAKEAVITANNKIEAILDDLYTEYGLITNGIELHNQVAMQNFWEVRVQLEVSI